MRPDRSSVSSLSRAAAHRALPLALLLVGTTSLFAADTLRALPPVPPAEGSVAWLGKWLFSDARLSSTGRISCASCHDPEKSFIDGMPHSTGEHRTSVGRNAPTLFGLRGVDQFIDPLSGFFRQSQLLINFDDSQIIFDEPERNEDSAEGGIPAELLAPTPPEVPPAPPVESNLSIQLGNPVQFQTLSSDPIQSFELDGFGGSKDAISLAERSLSPLGNAVEMGMNIDQTIEIYRSRVAAGPLFDRVFGEAGGITRERVGLALAAFIQSLTPPEDAPYAKHLRGEANALSAAATRGLELFEGKGACAQCHGGSDLRDGLVHAIRPVHSERPSPFAIDNAKIRVRIDPDRVNGPARQTLRVRNDNFFHGGSGYGGLPINITATPTLWDVARTAPYFGDGTMQTLDQALQFHIREMSEMKTEVEARAVALREEEQRMDALAEHVKEREQNREENGAEATNGSQLRTLLVNAISVNPVPVALRPEGELTGSKALEALVFPESLTEAEVADLLEFLRSLSPASEASPVETAASVPSSPMAL